MIDFEALRREMERNPEMFINPEESHKKKAKEVKQAQKEKQDKQAKQVNKNNSQSVKAVCIQKFRDKNNHIYGYRLQDVDGNIKDIKSEDLKLFIARNEIDVINLQLTSDNRLVDKDWNKQEKTNEKVFRDDSKTLQNSESTSSKSGLHTLLEYIKNNVLIETVNQLDKDTVNKLLIQGEKIYSFLQSLDKIHIPDIFIFENRIYINLSEEYWDNGYLVIDIKEDIDGIPGMGPVSTIGYEYTDNLKANGQAGMIAKEEVNTQLIASKGHIIQASNIKVIEDKHEDYVIFTLKFETGYNEYKYVTYSYSNNSFEEYNKEKLQTQILKNTTGLINDKIINIAHSLLGLVNTRGLYKYNQKDIGIYWNNNNDKNILALALYLKKNNIAISNINKNILDNLAAILFMGF